MVLKWKRYKVVKIVIISMVILCNFSIFLEARDFEKISLLDQKWELYWNKLLEPSDFQGKDIIYDKEQRFPFIWNNITLNNKRLSAQGFLTLKKKVGIPDLLVGQKLGLRVPEMFSAYKLFINGRLASANGIVSENPEEYQPQWMPKTIYFTAHQKDIEFVLQIANFSYSSGGSWRNIELDLAEKINIRTNKVVFFQYFLFASVLTMGFYHIGLFLKRKKTVSALYFSLVCATVSLRTSVSGEMFIYQFFNPSWEVLLKLNFITVALMAPLFIKFQQFLFYPCSNKHIAKASLAIGLLFTFIIIIFPAKIHSSLLDIYHITALLNCAYITFVFVKAIRRKMDGALLSLLAFFVIIIAAINDILAVNNIINSEQMLPIGLVVFFIAQSFTLAQKFSSALNREEDLSHELEELNEKLEEKVENRTIELKLAISEIKQLTGLLPICAKCKKIRDDKGYWNQIEEYLSEHSDAVFSHSMCPHCIKELYPEITDKMDIR